MLKLHVMFKNAQQTKVQSCHAELECIILSSLLKKLFAGESISQAWSYSLLVQVQKCKLVLKKAIKTDSLLFQYIIFHSLSVGVMLRVLTHTNFKPTFYKYVCFVCLVWF